MSDLDFSLPPRARIAWVSDNARDVWKPRVARVETALRDIAWMSVAEGVRKCVIVQMPPAEHVVSGVDWLKRGLHYLPVEYHESGDVAFLGFSENAASVPYVLRLLVAEEESLLEFVDALTNEDGDALQDFMGWPACCSACAKCRSAEFDLVDPMFPAVATDESAAGSSGFMLDGSYHTNILLRSVGLSILSHVPCSTTCNDSVALAKQLLEIGRGAGYADEIEWLIDILSWPVEWSALFGIVEILTATDARTGKRVLRREGTRYPENGAQALAFPYVTDVARQEEDMLPA